jgi:small ligand-binding sensory domain FIST
VKWCSSISDAKRANDAVRDALESLLEALGGTAPDLVLLFVSDDHRADHAKIAERVRNEWPNSLLFGCSANSVIGGGLELEDRPGLALTAAILPGVALRPFHLPPDGSPGPDAKPESWHDAVGVSAEEHPHFVLLADPFTCDVEHVIRGLDAGFPRSIKIGGVVSGGTQPGENTLYLGAQTQRSGLVGVAFSGNIELDTIIAQGCRPIGSPMFVTRCRENVLYELDGRPALEIIHELYEQASPRDQKLLRSSLFLGLEIQAGQSEYHQGDFLIRNLSAADQETGALVVAARPQVTQVVQFHLRDAQTSSEDLEQQLTRYRSRTPRAAPPEGALLFSCLGRGRLLYGRPDHDTEAFRRHLGDVPLTGFFCNGEIGPVQDRTFLHGYTSAYGLFRARQT